MLFDKDPAIFPFVEEKPGGRTRMGVKRLNVEKDWIKIDEKYPRHIRVKRETLDKHFDQAVASLQGESTDLAKKEVLQMLFDHLPRRFPTLFQVIPGPRQGLHNAVTNEDVYFDSHDNPLVVASRLIEEDLIIMERDSKMDMWKLTSGLLAFPFRWSIQKKIGLPMPGIHKPVPIYNRDLKDIVHSLFDDIDESSPVCRANWGIYHDLKDEYELWTPPRPEGSEKVLEYMGAETGQRLILRCEYQTLVKLPKSEAILFTIRTYQRTFESLRQQPIEVARALCATLEQIEPSMGTYKGGDLWGAAAIRYLKEYVLDSPGPSKL